MHYTEHARRNYDRAYELLQSMKNDVPFDKEINTLVNLGKAFFLLKNYNRAHECYKKASEANNTLPYSQQRERRKSNIQGCLAEVNFILEETDQAKKHYNSCLKLTQRYDPRQQLTQRYDPRQHLYLPNILSNLSSIHKKSGHGKKAKYYNKKRMQYDNDQYRKSLEYNRYVKEYPKTFANEDVAIRINVASSDQTTSTGSRQYPSLFLSGDQVIETQLLRSFALYKQKPSRNSFAPWVTWFTLSIEGIEPKALIFFCKSILTLSEDLFSIACISNRELYVSFEKGIIPKLDRLLIMRERIKDFHINKTF
jgi:tetratricopeptide (TPR) repeat protein